MKKLFVNTVLVSFLCGTPAFAQDNEEILKQLKAMQVQMESMQKEMNRLKAQLANEQKNNKAKNINTVAAKQKEGTSIKVAEELSKKTEEKKYDDIKISLVPAPRFETADGTYSFKVGGFAQIDGGIFDDDVRDRPDGTNIRRARLNVSGVLARDFKYKIENDFSGNSSSLTDVYLEYSGLNPTSITIGQFKEPFSLDTLTSDIFTSFIERASLTAFSPDRRIGIMASTHGEIEYLGFWTAALGGFGSGSSSTASIDDEAKDITGRFTWAPVADKTKALHFGIAGSHRIPDSSSDSFSFSSRAENQLSSSTADRSVDTGTISNVDNVNLLGLEAAGVYNSFALQGEYVNTSVNRNVGQDLSFNGYYVEASYYLTGESRNYKADSGKFDRVRPKSPFSLSQGTYGAWQFMARYSSLDLSDKDVLGGKLRDTTLGIKWLPNDYTMIAGNYIMSNTDINAVTPNDDPRIWLLRTQFDF